MSPEIVALILTGLIFPFLLEVSKLGIETLKSKFLTKEEITQTTLGLEDDLRAQLSICSRTKEQLGRYTARLKSILDDLTLNGNVRVAIRKYQEARDEFE